MIGTLIRVTLACLVTAAVLGYLAAVYLYKIKDEGTLYLPSARGVASITREADTSIPHVRANTMEAAFYA